VNRTLQGWFGYFKHSHGSFTKLDAWIRRRLRSVLRKRLRGHACALWRDNRRWPDGFFTAQGLFSLAHAHAAFRQSSRR
jgi:RNA-directed DNA polymerase